MCLKHLTYRLHLTNTSHKLGHHLGLETHDVSRTQRLLAETATMHDMQRQKSPLPVPLTTRPYDRLVPLEPNMVITIEPGM
jgi:Xaa-Pro aminopeptidase